MREKKYFAALNGGTGFVSFYDNVFSSLERVYIIKGGPGTGKSKLMRDIASEAENKCYSVEYFYCSADSDSLDGIIIKELNIGILDGTSPHVTDPCYPGVSEEILNLGMFWKVEKLKKESLNVHDFVDRKKTLYSNVYGFLSAAERIDAEKRVLVKKAMKKDKMHSSVLRLMKYFKRGEGYKEDVRLVESFGMKGSVYFDTFLHFADNKFIIKDKYGIGYIYIRMIKAECEKLGIPVLISYSPVCTSKENAIYLRDSSTCFVIPPDYFDEYVPDENTHYINMDRFIDKEIYSTVRQKVRFCNKCYSALLEGAADSFSEINKLHFQLEKIYIDSMDFSKKEAFTKKLLINIFK